MHPLSFLEVSKNLPGWKKELIDDAQFTPGNNLQRLVHELKSGNIIVATDGSVEDLIGNFGWAIAIASNGVHLTEDRGWVRGRDPSSHCTEIVGDLSVLCYLSQIINYFIIKITTKNEVAL